MPVQNKVVSLAHWLCVIDCAGNEYRLRATHWRPTETSVDVCVGDSVVATLFYPSYIGFLEKTYAPAEEDSVGDGAETDA